MRGVQGSLFNTNLPCRFSRISRPMWRMLLCAMIGCFGVATIGRAQHVAPPPSGKLYQGLYFDEPAPGRDPTEHDVTKLDVLRFEKAVGIKTSWVFFSNNWSESRHFPATTCEWVRSLGKVPYIRLM